LVKNYFLLEVNNQLKINCMIKNYDSVETCFIARTTNSKKQETRSYTTSKRNWLSFLSVFLMLFSFVFVQGQSSANYAFTSGVSALNSMTGSTPIPGIITFPADDSGSTVIPIGFNFIYMGTYYSHFSVNSNGQLRLHVNAGATAIAGTNVSAYAASTVTIAPMAGDNETGTGMSYLVTGAAPNRKLIIEWNNFYANFIDPQSSGNMQLVLNEGTGVIDFLYGSILNSSTSSVTRSIFHSSSNTANSSAFITVGATPTQNTTATAPTTNSFAASVLIANLANTFYKFTPPVPASGPTALVLSAATASSMTLNWTAAANTTGIARYAVFNSTNGGATYNFVANVALGTNTFNATGLASGTTYDWKVVAISEGVESTPATGSLTTSAASTYYWVGTTGGNWNTATNWNTAADNTGTTRTVVGSTDILIVDGDGTTPGGSTTINVDLASFTVGQFKVTSNTNVTLQSSATTTRIITISGAPGDDFLVESGSTLNLNSATNAVAFAFAGTGNTGLIAGTYNAAGSTSNVITTTGGTGTLVTVTGSVNNNIVGNSGCITGSTATLSFDAGSNYLHGSFTTGNGYIPLATWNTTSTVTISGGTTSTGITNPTQSFGNFIYNSATSTGTMSVWTTGTTAVIKGNLTVNFTGTGIFRALTTGTLNVNGDVVVTQGRLQSASGAGTFIANGNTTIGASGILDILAGTFSQRGSNLTNNGTLTGPAGTLQFLNLTGSFAQTLAGSGSVLTNIASLSMQNTAGLTITHTNPVIIARANLFQGTITGSNNITFGTGLAVACTTQIGAAGLTTPGGNFDTTPTFNLGTGTYALIYAQESVNRTVGFEVPPTRLVSSINLTNSNGLVLSGGNLGTGTLTFGAGSGNITTNSSNVLTITGTTVASIVRTSLTAYVNGPLARTLPPNLVTGSTYVFPIGKSTINPFELINPTTGASGNVVIQSEVFDSATGGTPGSLFSSLNSNRYWATSFTSGSSNFADALVRLNDNPNGADAIGSSETLTGVYELIGGLTSTVTASSITTTVPEDISALNYYVMASKATPTLSNLTITPQGNRCPAVARTVTVDVAIGAGAISGVVINYSINGVAQTAIAMTNTSGSTWSGTIPVPTPSNATIAWSVTATDVNMLTQTQAGVTYSDEGIGSEVITITPSVPNFCGTGGDVTLIASSTIPGVVYTWESLTSGVTFSTLTGNTTTATITTTTDFKVTGTPNDGSCPSVGYISVGVYALPAATVTTTASGVCPGTSATINSGLSAGNFISLPISHAPRVAPSNAVTLATAGTAVVTQTSGTLDDGGWGGVPVGFNFNFFGTNYNTINIGTNGTVMFGAYNGASLADFAYTTLPSTTEPFNLVAVLAMDNNLANSGSDGSSAGTQGGTLRYWTEGYAPNRKFIVSYENVREYGDTRVSTAQAIFYETTGIIEVHVTSSTNIDRNKLVGVNNGNGTIGVLAYASGTSASATNPITNPFAYRFTPPANYTTTWTATDVNGTTVIATGTNIFSQSVAPTITTTYSISYTNQTTGCTNAAGSAQVVMSVLDSNAPVGVNTIASATSICLDQSVNLSLDYTGITDGLVFQWQSSIDNGATWQNIASASAITATVTPTVPTRYRCEIISCGGTPGYSSVVAVTFANEITSTSPATRCGTGTASIEATSNTGSISWYATASGGSAIGTGSPFITPIINASTTYYASAETITNANVTLGSTAAIDTSFGTTSSPDGGMIFTTTVNNVVINSIDVLVAGTGDLTIKLQNSAGVDIASTTITGFSGSASTLTNIVLPSSFVLPTAGTGYRLLCTTLGSGLSWYYQTGAYPFASPGVSITSGWGWGATSTDLRFIHKMNMTVPTVCASPRVAVPVTVNPAPALTLSSASATICSGLATTVPVTITSNVADFDTYSWSPSTGVSGDSVSGWVFNPTTTTIYTLTATQTSGALCGTTATFTVNVNPLPTNVTITPAAPSICVNTIQSLAVTGGTLGVVGKAGSGNAVNTTSTPFRGWFGGSKTQALYTPAELTALGMAAGQSINSIGYVALSGTPIVLNNLTINAGFVSNTTLGAAFIPGASNVVLAPINYTPTATGNIDFALSTPLTWDGVSSLLIETCFNNNNGGGIGANSISVESTVVATGLNLYLSQDNNATVCTNVTAPTATTTRPNLRISTLETANVTWSPVTNLFTDAGATIPYVAASNATTVYVQSATPSTTVYTATATVSATGCFTSNTVSVTVSALPDTTITRVDDTLTAAEAGAIYQWYTCTAGPVYTPIGGATSQSYTATAIGSYAVDVTLNGCTSRSTCFDVTTLGSSSFDMNALTVYPNPFVDILSIRYNEEITAINVYDLSGRLVKQITPNQTEVEVNMSELAAAMYIVKVNAGGNQTEIKVIKK
jgi:hypothetical protein